MNVSSIKTKLDLFSACLTIFNKFLLGIKTPVGLLGLHRNTIPFFGIFFINSSRSLFRFIVL